MSTQFFLLDANADGGDGNSATIDKALGLSRGSSVTTITTNTRAGPTSGVPVTIAPDDFEIIWLSSKLQGVTISGLITFNFRMKESVASANVGAQGKVFRCDYLGNVISQIINSEKGTEMGSVSFTAQNWTATPTVTTLQTGDRLKVIVYGNDAGGTMASGNTFGLTYNGPTALATGDSYVLFSENISLMVSGHSLPILGAGN